MQIEADEDEEDDEPHEPEEDQEEFTIAKPGAVAFGKGKKEENKRKK